jgi:hypothetical protein
MAFAGRGAFVQTSLRDLDVSIVNRTPLLRHVRMSESTAAHSQSLSAHTSASRIPLLSPVPDLKQP